MTNKQKILISIPFYVLCAAIGSFFVGIAWSARMLHDSYKKDDPVGEMWSEIDPTS